MLFLDSIETVVYGISILYKVIYIQSTILVLYVEWNYFYTGCFMFNLSWICSINTVGSMGSRSVRPLYYLVPPCQTCTQIHTCIPDWSDKGLWTVALYDCIGILLTYVTMKCVSETDSFENRSAMYKNLLKLLSV